MSNPWRFVGILTSVPKGNTRQRRSRKWRELARPASGEDIAR